MSLCCFLCPSFIRPVQPVTPHRSMMRRLIGRTTTMSDFDYDASFCVRACGVWLTVSACVWTECLVMAAAGTFSGLWRIVGSSSETLRHLKKEIKNITSSILKLNHKYSGVLKPLFQWHIDGLCHCLINPGSILSVLMWPCKSIQSIIQYSHAQSYLVIKLTGGRGSAEAAAAVTQLPVSQDVC